MKKIFLSAIMAVAALCSVNAEDANTLYVTSNAATAGSQVELTVNMKNAATINSLQFEMALPKGLSVDYEVDGTDLFPTVSLSTGRTSSRKHDLVSSFKSDTGNLFVTMANKQATTVFSGNDGAVCTVTVNVEPTVAAGTYTAKLTGIVLTDAADNSSIKPADVEFPVVVSEVTAIKNCMADDNLSAVYNTSGSKLNTIRQGVNIVKTQNGSVQKVMVR